MRPSMSLGNIKHILVITFTFWFLQQILVIIVAIFCENLWILTRTQEVDSTGWINQNVLIQIAGRNINTHNSRWTHSRAFKEIPEKCNTTMCQLGAALCQTVWVGHQLGGGGQLEISHTVRNRSSRHQRHYHSDKSVLQPALNYLINSLMFLCAVNLNRLKKAPHF